MSSSSVSMEWNLGSRFLESGQAEETLGRPLYPPVPVWSSSTQVPSCSPNSKNMKTRA